MKAISHSNRSSSWRHVLLAVGVAAALLVPAMAQDAQAEKTKPAKAEKVKVEKTKAATDSGAGHWGPAINVRTSTNSAFSAAPAYSKKGSKGWEIISMSAVRSEPR